MGEVNRYHSVMEKYTDGSEVVLKLVTAYPITWLLKLHFRASALRTISTRPTRLKTYALELWSDRWAHSAQ